MVVQHNIPSMNANRYYNINNSGLAKSLEKLSSGYAINRAGDNAAGLAVSEKMRSQIGGLTQGVKNAQDGISMIQTYEGALTETDSILQRMKTLADQSANGTYQDEVDREAIQLEFNQLNDELDQIADTDFNGVVMLNGGQMADGLKVTGNKFDYSKKAEQVAAENAKLLADAQATAQKAIDSAQKAYDTAKADYDAVAARDLSNNGNAAQWNTVDNSAYTKDVAKNLFDGIFATDPQPESFDVTFTATVGADGSVTWAASDAKYIDDTGAEATKATTGELTAEAVNSSGNGGNGGFVVKNAADEIIANAVFDASEIKSGDTVTLTFTNTTANSYAPDNIGMDRNSLVDDTGLAAPTIEIAATLNNDSMDQETADALKKLDAATVSYNYSNGNLNTNSVKISDDSLTISAGDTAGEYNISFTNSKGEDVVLAKVTTTAGQAAAAAGSATGVAIGDLGAAANATEAKDFTFDGTDWVAADGKKLGADAQLGGQAVAAPTNGGGNFAIGDKITVSVKDTEVGVTVTYTGAPAKAATEGSVSFGVAVDAFNFDATTEGPTVKAGKDADIDSTQTTAIDKKYFAAKEALAAAKAAYPQTIEDLGLDDGVSKSDAFDQATAPLTYTDHLVLQAGARTKDAVDFTFQYDSEGLGNLKANLNCSSRTDGLGTADLSLLTQKDANAAIDKIDNAINKVSMVRATFGATQNRLEHKIDNMNVTKENITSAESRIRDTDVSEEMANFTKNQILSQASQSMLAQANSLPQNVLQLLG